MMTTSIWRIRLCDVYLVLVLSFVCGSCANPDAYLDSGDLCFCKLKGQIGDCSCNVDTVDHFNNIKIYPRLQSLLTKDYFRFYKVNLKSDCPFWADDSRCAIKHCHVKPCQEDEIPVGLKGGKKHDHEDMALKYRPENQHIEDDEDDEECDDVNNLGGLNKTISEATYKGFALWQAHDDAQDNFCTFADENGKTEYVDLLLNPERYTGYKGASAHRIWRTIYMENCFRPKNSYGQLIPASKLNAMCLEKRVFYRVLSGLHASINIHLCANYLFPDKMDMLSKSHEGGRWGLNLIEFKERFSPENTKGEGPEWLRNLYFTFLLELRAIVKAAPYLEKELYYTGNKEEDDLTRVAIKDFLNVAKQFPDHFNESTMFSGGKQALKLKEEFRQHFRNISRIMDCVGCEKCKLWGKLQVQGLGTALKILFSGKFDKVDLFSPVLPPERRDFNLKRNEIVALFNALGRLSTSIYNIESFRQLMR